MTLGHRGRDSVYREWSDKTGPSLQLYNGQIKRLRSFQAVKEMAGYFYFQAYKNLLLQPYIKVELAHLVCISYLLYLGLTLVELALTECTY